MVLFDIITKIKAFKHALQRSSKRLQERVSTKEKQ